MGYKKQNEKNHNKIGIYVSDDLYAKIEVISNRTGLGMSRTVRDIVSDHFEAKNEKKEVKNDK